VTGISARCATSTSLSRAAELQSGCDELYATTGRTRTATISARADGKENDVHHPVADRRGGRVQHCLHAGDGGHRQAADIAILRTWAHRAQHYEDIHRAGRGDRPGRHTARSVSGIVLALNLDVVVPFIEHLFRVQFLARRVLHQRAARLICATEVMLVAGLSS